jgi:hypothetical protein
MRQVRTLLVASLLLLASGCAGREMKPSQGCPYAAAGCQCQKAESCGGEKAGCSSGEAKATKCAGCSQCRAAKGGEG